MESYTYDRGTYFIVLGRVLTSIMICVVFLRLYSRSVLTRSIGSDDFAISVSACLNIYDLVEDSLWVQHGLGRHESLLGPEQITQVTKWFFIGWIITFISYFFIRASIMLFVLRLLPPGKPWQTRTILVTFFLNFAITVVATATYGAHCTPFQAGWNHAPGSHCLSNHDLAITQWINGILACVIDITTATIPQFLLWKVKMRDSTKRSLNIIFALGLVTAAMSIGRVATINYGTVATDISWRDMPSKTFALVEEKCGIIFASAPALRQFAAYISHRRTVFPTRNRQDPEEDFIRFRRRVNLRDLFWFRTPSVIEGRVIKPQRLFYPPSADQISDSETLVGETEKKQAEQAAKNSMLDVMRGRLKNMVGGGGGNSGGDQPTDSERTDTSSATKSSDSTLKTRLWNWDSLYSRNEPDQFGTRSSSEHVRSRREPEPEYGTQAIQIQHGFDVRSERSDSRQMLTEPAAVYPHLGHGM